jgi:Holliday junction resolvasome RuvABC endonuclease subunit
MPEDFRVYRFIGIDPGLNEAGVAIYDVDYESSQILNIEALTLINNHLPDKTGFNLEWMDERTWKLQKMKDAFSHILRNTRPVVVACEAPFFSALRPTAFAPLVEVVNMFRAAVMEYNSNIWFEQYPPLTVKQAIGARSIKNDTEEGKKEVSRALSQIPEIMDALVLTPLHTLSQHAADGTAVGYTAIKQRRAP